jgi:hypothetical protein
VTLPNTIVKINHPARRILQIMKLSKPTRHTIGAAIFLMLVGVILNNA